MRNGTSKTKTTALHSPLDRDPSPVVVPAPRKGLPFDLGWRPTLPTQNLLAFALARPFHARLERPDGTSLRVRIAACVTSGSRSFDLKGNGKTPRYAVLIEPRRRNDDLPPAGRYDIVSDCGWIGRLGAVPVRHVPKPLVKQLRARGYFHVV
jgi:hypothetical protein